MDLTRRSLLLLPALTVACRDERPAPAPVDPDVALVLAGVAAENELIPLYDALARSTPRLTATLTALRADHQAHLVTLTGLLPSSSSSPSPTPATAPLEGPVDLGRVRALLRTTQRLHAAGVLTASPGLAPVLASLAACEASHLAVL